MTEMIRGKAWVFPGQVTTDDILPGRYLDRQGPELGQFAMSGIDAEFATKVSPGDIVVAGDNFGSGSGRESAPAALRHAGIGAVVCRSAARVFYRNGINLGLPVVEVDSIEGIAPGDAIVIDVASRTVRAPKKDLVLPVRNLSGIALEILAAGGIVAYTKAKKSGVPAVSNGAAKRAMTTEPRESKGAAPVEAKPLDESKAGPFGTRIGWGRRPALVIVDFMRAYTTPGEPLFAEAVVTAVERTVPLLAAARAIEIPVIHTRVQYSESAAEGGLFVRKVPALCRLVQGAPAAEIVPELLPRPNEVVLVKQYASAFFGTPLASMLTALGVDTIVLAGCSTSGCIRATAVDGMQHGFRVIVAKECVGDRTSGPHEANLFDIDAKYGDVEPLARVLEKIGGRP
jgi:maleamate amidohydrolase